MKQEYIIIRGAKENNLKNFDLEIPKRKITVFTGVSGSGKSSIVFDTVAEEANRQLNENFSAFVRGFLPKYKNPNAESIENLSMPIVVDQSRLVGNARSTVGTITDINPLLRLLFSRFGKPYIGAAWNFSFNDPHGMCPLCEGIGTIMTLNLAKAINMEKSLNEGAIMIPGYSVGNWQWKIYTSSGFFDNDKPIKDYTEKEYHKLVYAKAERMDSLFMEGMNSTYEGLVERFNRQFIKTDKEPSTATLKRIKPFMIEETCSECKGKRYNQSVLECKINSYNIADMTAMQIDELILNVAKITYDEAQSIVSKIIERLTDLSNIGLGYMSLDRKTSTLSGGESQRVKMVKHLTSNLVDVMYIFDEPSIGLHPRDVYRLNKLLQKLRNKGNTVIVVEHDPDVIKEADYIIDIGPRAGASGGHVMFKGQYDKLLESQTLTGQYMKRKLPFKSQPRAINEFFTTKKSSLYNLKNISLSIPKGVFTVITGVAGSGKSTLVNGVFSNEFPESIVIDQSAVSANSRSNPATYTGIMDDIRKLFATTNNVNVGLFSYNSDGACPTCRGTGIIKTELMFMDSVERICEDCGGKRYKDEIYQYKVNGKSINEVLSMTIAEAGSYFLDNKINRKLQNIKDVGLEYMTLGQPLNTLSGGECQRIKLAKELNKKGNIYIMDEPTTGLHMSDVQSILNIIDKLVEKGNTVIVIEHNVDVMRSADWLIDIGPDGGIHGGEILYEGKPADLLHCKQSITRKYIG